jgi:error-prone DNA polymerase
MSFVHLHVHSHYSFLRGADSVDDLALTAQRHGMSALAITDRNGLYGAIPFQKACDENGIKPIFGAQLVTETVSCVALVRDNDGYASLCRAITALQLHQSESDFDLVTHLANDRKGLIVLSRDVAFLEQLQKACGPEDMYIEAWPGTPRRPLYEAHRRTGLPLVASNNVWFARPEDYARHRLLTAIGQNTFLDSIPPGEIAGENHYLKSPAEMADAFSDIPDAIENAHRIAAMCDHRFLLGVLRLPKFPFTDGRPAFDVLRDKTEAGLVRRYGVISDAVRLQVERELAIIREMRYADYFLIVADIVDAAKAMRIPTCGRGSAANSVVAYALELTHVEPLSHNLYFERFLNRGRSDCPDVDIDFSWRDRDRIIDWVYERYGRDRVAMIATHVTFAARGSVREIAKVMGVPPAEITRVTKRLPSGWDTGSIADAMKNDPRAHGLPADREPWRTVFAMAGQLHGFPKHLGIHAGGIVIAPSPLTDHLPLQPAAKETDAGHVIVTQWDMYPVEDMGLVKIDLLGNRSLAVIDDAVLSVKNNAGTLIDFTRFNPITDRKTKNIIRRGETMGCFYVESPSMRNLLRKLDCQTFDGLVAASSIIRPGIASSGMMQAYIERFHHVRRHGTHDPSWYLHPQMRHALSETYGVMAYQEDVLKVAESIAGMSPEDSDGLRKAMSKKRDFVAIERYRRQFVGGAITHGCTREVAQELWRQIESFSGYSFCKAHSASFALVSYQAAYLRAHHPAEFMAAVLSNYGGYYATFAYISEAKRMGMRILLPCVNRSEYHYTGADNWIRIGLIQIQNMHSQSLVQLLDERDRNGPFSDLADFVGRVPIPSQEIEILIRAGAFDAISQGKNRPELLRQLIMLCAKACKRTGASRFQSTLFPEAQLPEVGPSRDYDWWHVLACEAECIGFTVSAHPLDLYTQKLQRYTIVKASELGKHIGRTVTMVGWQVTRKRLRTRQDEPMVFITFEDTHGLYETVIFPREYRRLAPLTMNAGPFVIRGEVTEEYGALTVTVKDMRLLSADRETASQAGATDLADGRRYATRNWIRAA